MSDSTFKLGLALILAVAWIVAYAAARTMSPRRRLITNVLVRRLGWKPAVLGVIVAAVPYYNTVLGVMLLAPALLSAAHNLDRLWLASSLGEEEYRALLLRAAAGRRLGLAVVGSAGAGVLIALAGGSLVLLSSHGQLDWSFWFGLGIVMYGLIAALTKTIYIVNLHREASSSNVVQPH